MDVASINVPQESADRVARYVLAHTNRSAALLIRPGVFVRHRRMIAVTVLTATVVVIGVLASSTPFSRVAFAQVQQHVEKTRSVQYVEYMHEAEVKRQIEQAGRMLKLTNIEHEANVQPGNPIDRELLKKQFRERTAKVEKYFQEISAKLEKGEPVELRRVWIQGRHRHRAEQSSFGAKSIHITNAETGESVSLDPDRKSCILMKTQTVLNMKSGEKTETRLRPNPARDFYAQMTQVPSENVKNLGEKTIDEKTAVGFQEIVPMADVLVTKTWWIDKETKLPVRVEAVAKHNGVIVGGSTMADIRFDQEIDPELFSTAPPEGYSVSQGGFLSIDNGTEKE